MGVNNKPFTIEDIYGWSREKSDRPTLLKNQSYVNCKTKLKWKCECGEEFEKSFGVVKTGSINCKKCRYRKASNTMSLGIDSINKWSKECETRPTLCKGQIYKNNNSILNWVCKCGDVFQRSTHLIRSEKHNSHYCSKCSHEITYSERCLEKLKQLNCKIIDDLSQCRSFTEAKNIRCICNICGTNITRTYGDLVYRKRYVCKQCAMPKMENHHSWKGGKSKITHTLRSTPYMQDWKNRSLKKCNYRCDISGINSKDLKIHHLHSFDSIIEEVFSIVKMEFKRNIGDYSNKEMSDITQQFEITHEKYGLGVCLGRDIHLKFHSKYGFGNNVESQYSEFKKEYKAGELNE